MGGTGVDDVGGGVVGTGGTAAASVGLDEALPLGFWFARKKAKAAMHSVKAPMSATESQFLVADFALAGTAVASSTP